MSSTTKQWPCSTRYNPQLAQNDYQQKGIYTYTHNCKAGNKQKNLDACPVRELYKVKQTECFPTAVIRQTKTRLKRTA